MESQLTLRQPNGHEFPLDRETIHIGRNQECAIILNDPSVSRHHATIRFGDGRYYLQDQSSTNGTRLNGKNAVGEQALKPGDEIEIGKVRLQVTATSGRTVLAPGPDSALPRRSAMYPLNLIVAGIAILALVCSLMGFVPTVVVALSSATPTEVPPTATFTPTATYAPMPTFTPTVTPSPTQTPSPTPTRDLWAEARKSVVWLVAIDDNWIPLGSGSGSIVSARGDILTNFHVVGDDHGKLSNMSGWVLVGMNKVEDTAPVLIYVAQVVVSNPTLDIARLRIVREAPRLKDVPLPLSASNARSAGDIIRQAVAESSPVSDLQLNPITIGDSDAVKVGNTVYVLGYPGLADERLTLRQGIVTGFAAGGGMPRAWLLTDAKIFHGDSGGMAVNDRGELIGIPTGGKTDLNPSPINPRDLVGGETMGYLRPINLAKVLLNQTR